MPFIKRLKKLDWATLIVELVLILTEADGTPDGRARR
jgi:hypothetical protein